MADEKKIPRVDLPPDATVILVDDGIATGMTVTPSRSTGSANTVLALALIPRRSARRSATE